jgi:serine/threonine-protein phosphatase CPPED1
LERQQRLHGPGVYRLLCPSLVDARSRRSDVSTGEYLGMTRQLQGHWDKDFLFMQIAAPMFGAAAAAGDGAVSDSGGELAEERPLKEAIATINKLRPKFVAVMGNLTATSPGDAQHPGHVEALRKTVARMSETIPAIYVPGSRDVGAVPTPESLQAYRAKFGADYFGFWYGGVRGLVLNSSLLIHSSGSPAEAAKQEAWLAEEVQQCKLCATAVIVFSYHPWFLSDINEEDAAAVAAESADDSDAIR